MIGMSDFEEYIKLNYPRDYERQKRIYPDQSMEDLYSEDYKMWQHQQSKIDEMEKLRGLDEMAINQIAHANQQWQLKCGELQKRIDEALEDLEYPTAPWDETIASVVKVLRGES